MSKGYAIVPSSGGGGVLLPQTQAILAQLTGAFTWTRALQMNTLVSTLVSSGILSELDVFYMFANFDAQSSLVDWVNPSTRAATLIGAPAFVADQGYTGSAGNGINSQWSPSTSSKFLQNSNSIGAYSRSNIGAANNQLYGLTDVGNNGITMNAGNAGLAFRSQDNATLGGSSNIAVADTLGLFSNKRISNTQFECYKRGALVGTVNAGSIGILAGNLYILGWNFNGGSFTNPTTRQVAFFFAGSQNIDINTLYTAVQTYLTAIGAAV